MSTGVTQFLARIFQKTGETVGVNQATVHFSEDFNNLCRRVDEHNDWQVIHML